MHYCTLRVTRSSIEFNTILKRIFSVDETVACALCKVDKDNDISLSTIHNTATARNLSY